MREAALAAGLVRSAGAGDTDWRDRLRIITWDRSCPYTVTILWTNFSDSEPEAAAVHCAALTDLHRLKTSQVRVFLSMHVLLERGKLAARCL